MTGRRIGHLVASWPQQGGVADVIRDLVLAAAEAGDTAGIYAWPAALTAGRRVRTQIRLPADLARDLDHLDIVVLHGVFTPGLARAVRLIRRSHPRVRLVAFPHDAYDVGLFSSQRWFKEAYWRVIERPYLRHVDQVQITAPSHREWLLRRGVAVPVVMRAPGLPPALTRSRRPPSHDRPFRLLFVGRWDIHEKGLDLLVEALASSPLLRQGWRLRAVGPDVGAREQLAALTAAAGIDADLVGWVEDLDSEYGAADALVLPSRKEGFGLVAIQALAAGVPILVTDVAGVTEHLPPDAGWLRMSAEVRSIAAALTVALGELPRLRAQAEAFDPERLETFSWPRLHESLFAA